MTRCPFCPSPSDSREHLWADWISKALGPARYTFRRREDSGHVNQWRGEKIDVKATIPCKRCNNGWMSQLENKEAKPILKDMIVHGAPLSILPRGIASVAAYAFKSAVIASYMRPDRSKFFTRAACARFARTLQIPPGVQFWIGGMRTRQADRRGIFKSTYGKSPKTFTPHFELYVCTFAIGYVVLQVVATRFRKRKRCPFVGVIQDPKWNDFSVPLWPNNGTPILWPPRQHLSDDTIQAFCDRWRDFDVPQWTTVLS